MTKLFLPFLLCITCALNAQNAEMAPIRVMCLERDSTGLDKLSIKTSDAEYQQITFPETFPSRPVETPIVDGSISFWDPQKTDSMPVAKASIPKSFKDGFILFLPEPEAEGDLLYQTVALALPPQR